MDKQSRDAIRRLCEKPELREKAQDLFRSLKVKTARGSGFELNQRTIALPAIASFLASDELGYNDVTEKIAQAASCLNPKEFKAALTTVRKALASAEREKNQPKLTYQSLVARNANKEFMIECMQDVEAALTLSDALRGRFRPPNDIVTVSVYAWTCKILGLNRDGHVKQNGVSEDDYQEVVDALDANCQAVKKEIVSKVKSLRAERRANRNTEPATEPTSPQKSPRKSALRDASRSPTKTPAHGRKVVFSPTKRFQEDSDFDVEDTPSKRQKFLTPRKHSASQSIAAFKDALRGGPSPSKTPLQLLQERMEGDEDEEMDDEAASEPARSEISEPDVDAEMSDASSSSAAPSSMDELPTTPRRSQRQPKPRTRFDAMEVTTPSRAARRVESPSKRNKAPMSRHVEEDVDEVVLRRHRPVLLEHQQWVRRDARAVVAQKAREDWVRAMIQKRGRHPFEDLRAGLAA